MPSQPENLNRTRQLERRLGDWMRTRLPFVVAELVMFILKQGWAAIFGAALLIGILISSRIWQDSWPVARYDALLAYALFLQVLFLLTGMESWREVRVILLFHLTGTIMEIFKVSAGSWAYPGEAIFKLWDVPLFSGFMYAAVGSYMARVIRLFDMKFAPYPPFWVTLLLAAAIYVNFFAHHFIWDSRLVLFAATVLLFARTRIWFAIGAQHYWMPLPVAAFLSSFFLWVAENIGTVTKTWLYSGQTSDQMVSFAKMGSWYLLLYVSFVTVTLVFRDALQSEPLQITQTHATSAQLQE
ncbi:DUF817 domain-containing protein [Cognatishimia activa]|uniref:DUF817 domain-containing protein n=1 Tax=Cognatishimia activa TaxID=1715691 RepID=UPI0022324152|nr:DUF817 domain-containing protein [Cognatishimia activa]UZD91574.1 DUF817 domain-containing protein [Cognatishimia activa]